MCGPVFFLCVCTPKRLLVGRRIPGVHSVQEGSAGQHRLAEGRMTAERDRYIESSV